MSSSLREGEEICASAGVRSSVTKVVVAASELEFETELTEGDEKARTPASGAIDKDSVELLAVVLLSLLARLLRSLRPDPEEDVDVESLDVDLLEWRSSSSKLSLSSKSSAAWSKDRLKEVGSPSSAALERCWLSMLPGPLSAIRGTAST